MQTSKSMKPPSGGCVAPRARGPRVHRARLRAPGPTARAPAMHSALYPQYRQVLCRRRLPARDAVTSAAAWSPRSAHHVEPRHGTHSLRPLGADPAEEAAGLRAARGLSEGYGAPSWAATCSPGSSSASWRCRCRWRWRSPSACRRSTACTPRSSPGRGRRCSAARGSRSPGRPRRSSSILAPIVTQFGAGRAARRRADGGRHPRRHGARAAGAAHRSSSPTR